MAVSVFQNEPLAFDVFISYSRRDSIIAEKLHKALSSAAADYRICRP